MRVSRLGCSSGTDEDRCWPWSHTAGVATTTHLLKTAGLSGRGVQIGFLGASSVIAETFTPSLIPRSWLDQGIVTGLACGLDYLSITLTQDGLDAARSAVVSALPAAAAASPLARRPVSDLVVDLAVASAGLAALAGTPRRRRLGGPWGPASAGMAHGQDGRVRARADGADRRGTPSTAASAPTAGSAAFRSLFLPG